MAGAAISTFPYNVDIIAKIVGIHDFFITLFFVGLGMEIPNPLDNLGMLRVAVPAALMPKSWKKLTYQEILSYHVYHEKGCIRKEVCVSGSIIVERVPNRRFWTDKAEDAA